MFQSLTCYLFRAYILEVVEEVCDCFSFGVGKYVIVVYFRASTAAVEYRSTKVSHFVVLARMGAEATQLAFRGPETPFVAAPGRVLLDQVHGRHAEKFRYTLLLRV